MAIVRYVSLLALVIWLGGMLNIAGDGVLRRPDVLAYFCGAAMLIGLLLMKFIGPPPPAFRIRLVLIILMLGVTGYASLRGTSRALVPIDLGIGLILLSWYARE